MCPTSQMEMEKGAIGSHKFDGEGSTSTSDTQVVESHRSDGHGEIPHRSDGEGSHRYTSHGKGSRGDFYDKLQASWMSNCRSHKYTWDGEGIMWRSMTKHSRYRSNIVHHRSVINSMTKPYSS
jgi:hypothetical protein